MSDFKPGLEGVVAVETEIAEPDREGGALRYRGVDIEELVGHVPYENVWGLLVDDDLDSVMPEPEPYEPARLTGNAPADLQAETARLAGEWKLGKLNEISDEQARDDLGRLSAQMMGIVARSARVADGNTDVVPDDVVAQGETAAEKFLLRWRGEADPRHVKAIDTYWICTAEHGLNASTFTARVAASTGADCGAALSSAVGALSGPLHGGAPAYVKPMLEEVAAMGDPEKWVRSARRRQADHGLRPPHLPRRGSALAHPQADGEGARLAEHIEVAEELEQVALAALQERVTRPRAGDERRVLLGDRARRRRDPAAARTRDVRVLAGGRLVGAHPRAEAHGPPLPAVGALRRAGRAVAADRVTLAEAAAQADALAAAGDERELASCAREWDDELEAAARNPDYRVRGVAYRAIAQFRFRQKLELLRRGLEDESAGARGSALIALTCALGATTPATSTRSARCCTSSRRATRTRPCGGSRSSACRTARPTASTIQLLHGIAEDDEADREVREAARKVAAALVKKSRDEIGCFGVATPLVGLIMGSRSDWETMRHAAETLDELGDPVRAARRLGAPDARPAVRVRRLGGGARAPVLIAGAGGAAHLPGMTAAKTRAARARRPGRVEGALGHRLAALDRADAGRDPGRDARDRPRGRGQRRAPRRVDPRRLGRPAIARAAARPSARRRRRPCSTVPTRPREPSAR